MGVFIFVCRSSADGEWSGKLLKGDLEASAGSTYELQRKLVNLAVSNDSAGGVVRSSFAPVTPNSAVFEVIIGGGGAAVAAVTAAATTPAADQGHAAAEVKEAEKEESDEDGFNFSLFD